MESSPESILWTAVINQTLIDLETSIRNFHKDRKSQFSIYQQCHLEDVLIDINNKWMRDICDHAGFSHEKLLVAVDKILKQEINIKKDIGRMSRFKKKQLDSFYH